MNNHISLIISNLQPYKSNSKTGKIDKVAFKKEYKRTEKVAAILRSLEPAS